MPNKERQGKWQPFDALEGFKVSLKQVEQEQDKIAKPIIYPDQLEIMNEILQEAYENHNKVKINFYRNGNIYEKIGVIDKVDFINKTLKLDGSTIKINMIVDIKTR